MKQAIKNFILKNNLTTFPISINGIFRSVTRKFRVYPTFIIIGSSRCGTTALYDYLTKNKHGFPATLKEIHFFDSYFDKGMNWYKANFPTFFHRKIITGDSTTAYLENSLVAKRVFLTLPKIKLIILVRNPVDRAFSNYKKKSNNLKRKGMKLPFSFDDIIEKELAYLKSKPFDSYSACPYVSRGLYYQQLKVWEKYFSRKQILIIKSEDFFQEPLVILEQVYNFLGVEKFTFNSNIKVNQNKSEEDETLNPNTRKKLQGFYRSSNEKLLRFWNVDFTEQ